MSENKTTIYDVGIIGAGPAGISAAIYTARAGLKTLVLGNPYESQVAELGLIENYAGFAQGVQGLELAESMDKQAKANGAKVIYEQVIEIKQDNKKYVLKSDEDESYNTKSLILAMGSRHRKMRIPGEDEYYGKGVSYCAVCDGSLYRGKPTAVLGHGNGAAKAVLYLSNISSKVYLLCNRKELGADAIYEFRLKQLENLEAHYLSRVTDIKGNDYAESLVYKEKGQEKKIDVEGIFIEFGSVPNTLLAEQLNLEVNEKGFIITDPETKATNKKGIYAAGDVCGNIRQIATAVGDGCIAAYSVQDYLREEKDLGK
ncbi:MAG: FAD-dependent oxidoreductase [Asgard group archaeon]|nr:FAD-dependent oxidoreductase [Asgard group archaeon]